MAPPVTLRPKSVPWGPLSTSMLSISSVSNRVPFEAPTYTPSTNTPTVGSTDGMELFIPSPRIEKLAIPPTVPMSSSATLGIVTARLSRSLTLRASISSELKCVTESGTFWIGSSRFRAVTVIFSSKTLLTPNAS